MSNLPIYELAFSCKQRLLNFYVSCYFCLYYFFYLFSCFLSYSVIAQEHNFHSIVSYRLYQEFNDIKHLIEIHTEQIDGELEFALTNLISILDPDQNSEKLRCKNLTHYHQVHQNLAVVTLWFHDHPNLKLVWKMFLHALHDRLVILLEQEDQLRFDSHVQLELLEDKTLKQLSNQFVIELLHVENALSDEKDFQTLIDIFKESFSLKEWFGEDYELGILFLKDQIEKGESLVFVLRYLENPRTIVGMIWARYCNYHERSDVWQIYNVCRRAAYVKLNIGKRLLHFMQNYTSMTYMFLHVDPTNMPAYHLYKNAGFVQSPQQIEIGWPAQDHFISMFWQK